MKKAVLMTLVGLVLCFGGIAVMYIFLTGIDHGASPLLLLLVIALIGAGSYSLFRAAKTDYNVKPGAPTTHNEGTSIVERNNQLAGDFKKTADARDRLKILETAQDNNVL